MVPSTSLRNLTPSSTGDGSITLAVPGTIEDLNNDGHGQSLAATVTLMPAPAASMLPLSSIARLLIVTWPSAPGTQL